MNALAILALIGNLYEQLQEALARIQALEAQLASQPEPPDA